MSKSLSLTSRLKEGHSSWPCLILGQRPGRTREPGSDVGPLLGCGGVCHRVLRSCKGLVQTCMLGERSPHLALELRRRSRAWGGLEEVLGQL